MMNSSCCLRRSWISLWAGLLVLACLSCTGNATDIASGSIGSIITNARKNTVLVNVTNATANTVQVTLRVDDVDKILPACTAVQKTCNYSLATCPAKIELIQAAQLDASNNLISGFNFEGDPNYVWQQGDYQCGGQLIIQVSGSKVTAIPM